MSKKPGQHVVSRGDQWAVVREGASRASSVHPTQKAAIAAATDIARKQSLEVYIHGQNGQIRERNSFGNDPFPPEG
jgi:Uncharacterized protein conserved in bacteria (DUF2188)